jgi:sugar lactone lactonase YvrE
VSFPDDITVDERGNFYIASCTAPGEVYRVDPNGMKKVIAAGLKGPNGIHYNLRTGRLFMSECFFGNRVFELDPTGVEEPRLVVSENVIPIPEGFGFDPDTNDLIIPDLATGKILRVDPDSGQITTIAEGFITPVALEVGPDKMVYIPELATGNVFRLSLDGKRKEKVASIAPGLDNLAISPKGELYVTSYWDSTVYEVSTDGSGKYRTLTSTGPNRLVGLLVKAGKVLAADHIIMIRAVENGVYLKTKLNAWAVHGMPLPLGLADGPGDQILWPDSSSGRVAMGNPMTGEFKVLTGGLSQPAGMLMEPGGDKCFVTEYGAGQITEVQLADGARKIVSTGLEGPLALAMIDGLLYVAEAKSGRIIQVDPGSGRKEVFLSGLTTRPGALGADEAGNLYILDGGSQKLLRVNPKTLAVSVLVADLPVGPIISGSYPVFELALPMTVTGAGELYIATVDRALLKFEKSR